MVLLTTIKGTIYDNVQTTNQYDFFDTSLYVPRPDFPASIVCVLVSCLWYYVMNLKTSVFLPGLPLTLQRI